MKYPNGINDSNRMAYLLRCHELLRLDCNAKGAAFVSGEIDQTQWDEHCVWYRARIEAVVVALTPLMEQTAEDYRLSLGESLLEFMRRDVEGELFASHRSATTFDPISLEDMI